MADVMKMDFMLKRSQMKGKFTTENYKNRWFQLTATVLRYCDGSIENGVGKVKGQIELSQITVVEKTDADALGNRPNAFQVVYKSGEKVREELCTLYIIAVYDQQKTDWIDAIRNACSNCGARFSMKFHPGVWLTRGAKYSCCESLNKRMEGCQPVSCPFATSSKAVMRRNLKDDTHETMHANNRKSTEGEIFGFVFAMYDYTASDPSELDLSKGTEYELLEKFNSDSWLKVKNAKGKVGNVPGSYVKLCEGEEKVGKDESSDDNLEEYEWFYKKTSRSESEAILQEDGREGCFMVRDSSQKGVYTLAVYRKASANEKSAVKHYHIKQSPENSHYYLTDKHQFATVPELIYYHKHNSGGLIVRLRFPPKERMKPILVLIPDTEEIDISLLKLGEEIGAGTFGKVHKGIYKGNIEVAIKSLKNESMSEDDFIDEAKTMVKLNHENLVKLYGVCTKKKPILIITEFMKYGALLQYLRRNKICLPQEPEKLLDFSLQISSGMKFLEEHSVIHRDLAARNCLVGDRCVVKVADFGLARCVIDDEYKSSAGSKFPVRWSSPEVLGYSKFSSKSDVWSFGILMWEIYACGEMPYGKWKNADVVDNITNRRYKLPKPDCCPYNVYEVMRSCWAMAPEDRPAFASLNAKLQTLAEVDEPNPNDD